MSNGLKASAVILQLLFVTLPTFAILWQLVGLSKVSFLLIDDAFYYQYIISIGLGLVLSTIFHASRVRFLPGFILLIIIAYLGYGVAKNSNVGGFDGFYFGLQFLLNAIVFSFAWLIAWVSIRWPKLFVFIALAIFILSLSFLLSQPALDFDTILVILLPLLIYTVYVSYAANLLQKWTENRAFKPTILRLIGAVVFTILICGLVLFIFNQSLVDFLKQYNQSKQPNLSSLLQQEKDGSTSLSKKSSMKGSQGKNNELLFAAKIDNYFEDGQANPLYLTGYYYSKYDTSTETFEIDSSLPSNDLFKPDLSRLPLYFSKVDAQVLDQSSELSLLDTVSIEVYKTKLSEQEFLAPTTAFYAQPIGVELDGDIRFKSAYRAKSLVSQLNSAYFVYNPKGMPALEAFQTQRFEVLRKIKDFEGVPKPFMDYYLQVPENHRFAAISSLAKSITEQAKTPVDKIIAIRDFFLSNDAQGKPLFRYSDNPGVPDIPSMSKLNYFLFENRKGYCAYYAGATLFMLRSLGIPSRIAAGFLTQDRNSGANKGWYWFYADQAHAWVQVYFPGLGWIDFDTTVGNDAAQEAPQPDGTPPQSLGEPLLSIPGKVISLDSVKQIATVKVQELMFKDARYSDNEAATSRLDLSLAKLKKDTAYVSFKRIEIGDSIFAVSYAAELKTVKKEKDFSSQLSVLGKEVPIDFAKIKGKTKKEQEDGVSNVLESKSNTVKTQIVIALLAILTIVGLFFMSFYLIRVYWAWKYNRASLRSQASIARRIVLWELEIMDIKKEKVEPWTQFSQRVQRNIEIDLEPFLKEVQTVLYTEQENKSQRVLFQQTIKTLRKGIKQHFTPVQRMKSRFNFVKVFNALKEN